MNVNKCVVTFWFDNFPNAKDCVNVLEEKLDNYFSGINIIGVPANINPEYPRITAVSDDGNIKMNISRINLQLINRFKNVVDDKFKNEVLDVYNVITEEIKVNVLYGAILLEGQIDDDTPVDTIKNKIFSSNISKNYYDVGVKTVEVIENEFYKNIVLNSTKKVTINKKIEKGQNEIVVPLISLVDATIESGGIGINYEINDKYSFDNKKNYSLDIKHLKKMFKLVNDDLKKDITDVVGKEVG